MRFRLAIPLLALALVFGLAPARADDPHVPPQGKPAQGLRDGVVIPIEARSKIDPGLLKQLLEAQDSQVRTGAAPQKVTFLVHLRPQAPLQDLAAKPSRLERRQLLVERLRQTARQSQAGLIATLENKGRARQVTRYRSFWVFNGLAVDGDLDTAIELAQRPEVESIRPNRIHRLPQPQGEPKGADLAGTQPEWNVRRIGADTVWHALGITGQGIVVANMDSGVDWTHPALQHKYRGYNAANPDASTHDYNWFDATDTYPNAPGPSQPHLGDSSDHGTHTMGTILGSGPSGNDPIGVAPGAQWIAVKTFNDNGYTTDEWLHAGFQWCLAPTDLDGENPDPSKAPDIVSNSWGDDAGASSTFMQDVAAWRAAGIFSAWAAGNAGPDPGTVGSPASYGLAFSVGAVDDRDGIAYFSSRGPSPWGEIKPEVVAPGVDIRSAIAGGSYESGWNGTSMATPHVAGLAALMWEAANHSLSITATEYIITSTATNLPQSENPAVEDNLYGYGLINAYQAVATISQWGTFVGNVRDAVTGSPLGGVEITVRNRSTGSGVSAQTQANGTYSFTVAAGRYDVTASKFAYQDASAQNIEIITHTTTQLDLSLMPLPSGTLRGQVSLSPGGQPVSATVQVIGTPLSTPTDASGYYTFTLPVGTYTVRALGRVPGFRGLEIGGIAIAAGLTQTVNLLLTTAPRLLLVNAAAWTTSGTIEPYQEALDSLLYSYDRWAISNPPDDNPTTEQLAAYDLVIWSQPVSSPGYLGAWGALGGYLDGGGRLLLSGQDIGHWDDLRGYGPLAYEQYLSADCLSDSGGLGPLSGLNDDILAGVTLSFNTPDSAANQSKPDVIVAKDSFAKPIMAYGSGAVTGLKIDACPYRTVYLGFGLEGVGPASARAEALSRMITWLAAPQSARSVALESSSASHAGTIGQTAIHDLTLINLGQSGNRFALTIDSPTWPAILMNPTTGAVITQTSELPPCARMSLRVMLTIPEAAPVGQVVTTTVRAAPLNAPQTGVTRTLHTTAFHPWAPGPSLPTARYRLAGGAVGCSIYAIGGLVSGADDDVATTLVEALNLNTGAWSTLSPKPTASANSASVALGGRLYLFGGYDPSRSPQQLDTVEVYDPATNQWDTAAPLPAALSGACAAAVGGKIYVLGGLRAEETANTTYIYNPATDGWSEGAAIPIPVAFGAAVGLNGSVYLAGGWPAASQLYRYDPAANTWAALAPMHHGRQSPAMVTDGEFIYVAGGGDEWDGLESAERYDPATNTWTEILPLQNDTRAGALGVYVDGQFWVTGGADSEITNQTEYLDIRLPLSGSAFTVDSPIAKAGDTLRFTLSLRNPTANAVTADWTHTLPPSLSYVTGSATGGASYNPATRTFAWAGQVPAAGGAAFSFQATVGPAPDNTVVTSTVSLNAGGCVARTLQANTLIAVPSLAQSTKSVDKLQALPGERLLYTIRIVNGSPLTITSASLVDPLPAHTTYVPDSVSGGATYNAAQNRIEWTGTIPPAGPREITFGWIDATGGQALELGDDDCEGPLTLGFPFQFYGQTYTSIHVNSNGMVLLGGCNTAYNNGAIPNESEPNTFIAPFWDDLAPNEAGQVYFRSFGQAPHRYVVIEWHDVQVYNTDDRQTFEVILYEGSNRILCQYLNMTGDRGTGSQATVGLESPDGTEGVQHLYDGEPAGRVLYDGLAIELVHSSTRRASVHEVSYAVTVSQAAPPHTAIVNTAYINDGLAVHARTVTSTLPTAEFANSAKQVQPASALTGETVTYTLRLVNSGSLTTTNTRLVDPLPTGLSYVAGSVSGTGAIYNATLNRIEWAGSVPPTPEGVTISYRATVNATAINSWITNTATIYEGETIMASPQAGLLVNEVNLQTSSKTAHANQIPAGVPVTYTLTLRNTGRATAPQAILTDTIPGGLDIAPGSLEGGTYDGATRTIRWQGALPPTGEHLTYFQAVPRADLANGTIITNTATLGDGAGVVLARAVAVTVLRSDLAQSELVIDPALILPGGTTTLTFRLRNTGAVDSLATLHCSLPGPLLALPGTTYASSGVLTLEGNTLSWTGTLLPGSMTIVRVDAQAPEGIPDQTIVIDGQVTDTGGNSRMLSRLLTIGIAYHLPMPLIYN